ncbi:zinc transporter ZntB [Tepidamorphus sp. 3E244]|uniref:zinc transporter ZntB n=1 Tax=Tepidamorphus sp. 3E244 TaxID=3385498 RepID=UPI0038FCB018
MHPGNHVTAYRIAADGTSVTAGVGDAGNDESVQSYRWVHIHGPIGYLRAELAALELPASVTDALTAEETRPRCTALGAGAIVILRGVNLNEGAEPEDMISLRIWLAENLVVTCSLRPLRAVGDVTDMASHSRAPASPAALVAAFAVRLADRAEPVVAQLNEAVDAIEERMGEASLSEERRTLADTRRAAILLRRYMFPQRDALTTLELEGFSWIGTTAQHGLREAVDRVTRLCEELDALRDRAQILQDQIMDERAETMNRQMLVLTIVAAFFLPIGFLTGLLGMNVGGVPLTESPFGFWIICTLIAGVVGLEYVLFRIMRLI